MKSGIKDGINLRERKVKRGYLRQEEMNQIMMLGATHQLLMGFRSLTGIGDCIPIWEKFALTVNEAMQYFNIGEKKIRKFVDNYEDYDFIMMNGTKALIKRKKFEDFLNDTSSF